MKNNLLLVLLRFFKKKPVRVFAVWCGGSLSATGGAGQAWGKGGGKGAPQLEVLLRIEQETESGSGCGKGVSLCSFFKNTFNW